MVVLEQAKVLKREPKVQIRTFFQKDAIVVEQIFSEKRIDLQAKRKISIKLTRSVVKKHDQVIIKIPQNIISYNTSMIITHISVRKGKN